MGINEKIITGRKFRRLIDKDSKLWLLISWWTKAKDVEFDDGKTAEQKLGDINGITSDFSVDDESIAASSNLTNRAYERFSEFTDNGKVKRIIIGEDGKPYIEYEDGADTVLKKLGEVDEDELTNSVSDKSTNEYTKGTWLYYISIAYVSTGLYEENPNFGTYFNQKKCTITDPDVNSIKRIYMKQQVDDRCISNQKASCGTYVYIVKVNTETAKITVSFEPNSQNHYGSFSNSCKVKIAD